MKLNNLRVKVEPDLNGFEDELVKRIEAATRRVLNRLQDDVPPRDLADEEALRLSAWEGEMFLKESHAKIEELEKLVAQLEAEARSLAQALDETKDENKRLRAQGASVVYSNITTPVTRAEVQKEIAAAIDRAKRLNGGVA